MPLHEVKRFREKPDLGHRRVNSSRPAILSGTPGIFFWKARPILDALREFRPAPSPRSSIRSPLALATPDEAAAIARIFPADGARADR